MNVLVSGSTGFIGRALTQALEARGDSVFPLTRHTPSEGEATFDLSAGTIDGSRLPGGDLSQVDAAVHLAGKSIVGRWTGKRLEEIRASRIGVGYLLSEALAAVEKRPAVLVTGSAVGFYGEGGDADLDEESPIGTGFLPSLCSAWESAAAPAREAGIRCVAVRSGIVLGPGGGALAPQVKLFKMGLGGRLGSGQQWISWIALDDEVGVILRALDDATLVGPVNATSPNPCRNSDFTAALARALGRRAPLPVPGAALRFALGRGPVDEMVLLSQRVLPRKLEAAGYEFRHPAIEDALTWALAG